jgi:hypothetical protein
MTNRNTKLIRFSAVAAGCAAFIALAVPARPARADLQAAYVQGYGGQSDSDSNVSGGTSGARQGALGVQAGARVTILELYGDYTRMGEGMSVQRGILGLRVGLDFTSKTRLELRLGGGAIAEEGGALTGPANAPPNRAGVVGRAGVNLEHKMLDTGMLMLGVGVNGETFTMTSTSTSAATTALNTDGWVQGSDIMASLHLKFEIGI